jgi:hypothetical protein
MPNVAGPSAGGAGGSGGAPTPRSGGSRRVLPALSGGSGRGDCADPAACGPGGSGWTCFSAAVSLSGGSGDETPGSITRSGSGRVLGAAGGGNPGGGPPRGFQLPGFERELPGIRRGNGAGGGRLSGAGSALLGAACAGVRAGSASARGPSLANGRTRPLLPMRGPPGAGAWVPAPDASGTQAGLSYSKNAGLLPNRARLNKDALCTLNHAISPVARLLSPVARLPAERTPPSSQAGRRASAAKRA